MVALHWLNNEANNLKTYVSNRVSKIQQTGITILHIPGKENSSDLCTKPKSTKTYVNNHFWLHGPTLLEESNQTLEEKYKLSNMMKKPLSPEGNEEIIREIKKEPVITKVDNIQLAIENYEGIGGAIHKSNKLTYILNVVARCFRLLEAMIKNFKDEERKEKLLEGFKSTSSRTWDTNTMSKDEAEKLRRTPSIQELLFARSFLIKEAQMQHFSEEYEAFKNGKQISEKSSLRKLNPQLKNGIITMISRLNNLQQMPEQMKNTIILSRGARISTLIILEITKW